MAGNLFALLVGIDRYSMEGRVPPLRGCVADVIAMRDFLVNGLGAPADQVRLLVDEAATRTAIIDGWRTHLRDRVQAGDFVLFHYSGHGSQAPSLDSTESDQLDETIVAYDSRDEGQYDLLDKELGALIGEVEQKGAQVALLMDCCHSGHITRARGENRPLVRQCPPDLRQRPPSTVLSMPAAQTRSTRTGDAPVVGNYVLLAACRDEELANEYRPPELRQWRGALTFFFLQALQPYHPGLTWADLYDRVLPPIRTLYPNQTPQLEGPGERLLFGGAAQQVGSYLLVVETRGERSVKVNGGAAVGLVAGSRLAIHPPASNLEGRPLATATVEDAEVDTAWATLDRPLTVEPGSRVKITAFGYGEQRAVVAVDEPLVCDAIAAANQGQPSNFVQIVSLADASATPAFVVVLENDTLLIQDATGETTLAEAPATAAGAAQIARNLEHLAIYRNVERLRNHAADPALRGAVEIVDRSPSWQIGSAPVVTAGQRLAFRLHNRTRQPLYVTVLHLAADFAIRRVFPDRGYTEKLAPGSKTPTISVQISGLPTRERPAYEQIKVFVTTTPTSFDALRLPPLNEGEVPTVAPVRADSPLGWLLDAVRRSGARPFRPVTAGADDQWSVEELALTLTA
jgi:hypothetical protein